MDNMNVTPLGDSQEDNVDDELPAARGLSFDIEELNQAPEEEEQSNSNPKEKSTEEGKTHKGIAPEIGMEFETDQHAYDFYKDYARKLGFSIRKEWINKNKLGVITRRKICCSREGTKKEDRRVLNVKMHRHITRVNCKAHLVVAIQPNKKFRVTEFEATHTHPCNPRELSLSRSRKKMALSHGVERSILANFAIAPKITYDFNSAQPREPENFGILSVDYKNKLCSNRTRSVGKEDAGGLLQYLQKMVLEDPGFVYAIQLDAEDLITNIFWADSRMVLDYHAFGDIVCFNTMYRTNNFDRPFAPFMGVNHHKKTVIFGASLMYDETVESYKWVFGAFLDAMSNKHPQTILTDQDKAMANAIALVMPTTFHRICVWHIYHNAIKNLSHIFNSSRTFDRVFSKCIYDCDDEDDFLRSWNNMLDKYNLRENPWLQELFNEREKWALVYRRDTFYADMKSTQRSESLNGDLKRYLHRSHDLMRSFWHFECIVREKRKAEDEDDFKMRQSISPLVLPLPILIASRKLYTPETFKIFQDEYGKGMSYTPKIVDQDGPIVTYQISWVEKNRENIVTFDATEQTVACNCKNFNFTGILCGHALRVIDHMGLREVPDRYILKRWRKDAKSGIVNKNHGSRGFGDNKKKVTERYKELMHKSIKLNNLASEDEEAYSIALKYSDLALAEVEEFFSKTPPIQRNDADGCEGANDNYVDIDENVQCSPENDTITKSKQGRGAKRKERGNASDSIRRPLPEIQPNLQIGSPPYPFGPPRHPALVTQSMYTMQRGMSPEVYDPSRHSIPNNQSPHVQGIYHVYQQSQGHLMNPHMYQQPRTHQLNQFLYPTSQGPSRNSSHLGQASSISGTQPPLLNDGISREDTSGRGQRRQMQTKSLNVDVDGGNRAN